MSIWPVTRGGGGVKAQVKIKRALFGAGYGGKRVLLDPVLIFLRLLNLLQTVGWWSMGPQKA